MRIVITAEGIVSAIGNSEAAVVESLQTGTTGIGTMHHLASVHKELPMGEVKMSNAEMKRALHIADTEDVSRTSLMGIMAIQQVVDTLPTKTTQGKGSRMVLVSGTTVGTMDLTERYYARLLADDNLDYLAYHGCGGSTDRIAHYFGIFDEQTTISTACSSAANAIVLGANLIKSGEADVVVAGGTEALSVFHLNGFNSLMILDHQRCRPFDATRAGLNLGEGAAYVVLESEEHARRRGATIHAYLAGYGNACDAHHQTASSPNGEGAFLAMNEALRMAQIKPETVDYVNAHGTGTPNNDQSESVALQRVFGTSLPPVSSTKSFTGHTTSASGSIETVISLFALRHHFIPANLGWAEPMPDGIIPTQGAAQADVHTVLCNSFGFGGNDTSIVLTDVPPVDVVPTYDATKPIRVMAQVEINNDEQLTEIRRYVKPLEARRMGKLLKSSLLSSLQALEKAHVDIPDAIITATAYGCIDNSARLLEQLMNGEEATSPTFFMQSTHNTIGSNIAIRLHCHGYNTTYSHRNESLSWALRDAAYLLRSGQCKTVLVGSHDEKNPLVDHILDQLHAPKDDAPVHSIAMVLTCGE